VTPDRRAELEEERHFLLHSLADLDREHAAGDVDDADYATLREGYVARAAAVLRLIERDAAAAPKPRPVRRWRVAGWVAGTLVVAAVAGWAVARYSGQRAPGQVITGNIPGDTETFKLAEARSLLAADPAGAASRYREVLELDPDNPEALTYSGWLVAIQGFQTAAPELVDLGAATLRKAIDSDPNYADPHCLLAVALGRFKEQPEVEEAREEAQACLDNNPPADMVGLVEQFLAGLGPTTTAG
jgi:predicted Zn-dependent protease